MLQRSEERLFRLTQLTARLNRSDTDLNGIFLKYKIPAMLVNGLVICRISALSTALANFGGCPGDPAQQRQRQHGKGSQCAERRD
jgi:hypothetical protein